MRGGGGEGLGSGSWGEVGPSDKQPAFGLSFEPPPPSNVPGALSNILESLASNDIFIEYMYAFSEGETANVVIRANDMDKCVSVLGECGCTLIKEV